MLRPLRISFDLDDTLVVFGEDRLRDRCLIPLLLRPFFRDPLRQGSHALLHQLHQRGAEIWIYTTSRRSESAIRVWWWLNRLPKLCGVINQFHHEREMQRLGLPCPPTKLPGHWHIDVHVDDSEGVRMEQPSYSSARIVVISPTDGEWVSHVIEAVDQELSARNFSAGP